MTKKMTTEEFIRKAREVHGDKYDYSKVEYKGYDINVHIICPEHGEFQQSPSNHLAGKGCRKCGRKISASKQTMGTEEFIRRAREVHGDKYDYSKVNYINGQKSDICIICHEKDENGNEHGEFWQKPQVHLRGSGCDKCSRPNRNIDKNTFIRKARKIHNDKYDYSKVEFVNMTTPVTIICHEKDIFGNEHGEFPQTPTNHLLGNGCNKCCQHYQMTTEEFIEKAKAIHRDKYDYSKVKYINAKTPITFICNSCKNEFERRPQDILKLKSCPICGKYKKNKTTEDIIREAKMVHGDKYDYSETVYKGSKIPLTIICHRKDESGCEHGRFSQFPGVHLSGCGCKKCWNEKPRYNASNTEEFIKKAREIHGNKYDYSKVEYKGCDENVSIICPEHGEFQQTPYNHLKGRGCPNCSGLRKEYKFNLLQEFESEYAFRAFLANNDINILQVILRNIEPKFEPIKRDIEKALMNVDDADPIQSLEEKYKNEDEEENEIEVETIENKPIFEGIDLDDDEAVNAVLNAKVEKVHDEDKDEKEPTIEDVVKNNEQELQVINSIEHMLTPEDREYIMKKFLNDKRRAWIAERESKLNK